MTCKNDCFFVQHRYYLNCLRFLFRFHMEKCLNDIFHIDKQMIQNHQVTCENHEQLLVTLKKINNIIQNASRLRG